jgi:flagellar biosynthesis protein FliP
MHAHRQPPEARSTRPRRLVRSAQLVAGFLLLLATWPGSALAVEAPVVAAPAEPGVSLTIHTGEQGSMSAALKIILALTALAFAPALLLCVTSFTRIIIVLAFARQALGTGQTPPNQVLLGIALFLTMFTMGPTAGRIQRLAIEPCLENRIDELQAIDIGATELKTFLLRHTRESDLALFLGLAEAEPPTRPTDIPLRVAIPSFLLSELKTAFQMGFVIFVPFLLIDLVVASVLMALGMMMVPPVLIALPFKLLLFVLVDGWQLLVGSLAHSFL